MYKLSLISILFAILGNSISLHLLPTHMNTWVNGIVPLEIKGNYSPKELEVINAAIDSFHKETCIKFVPRTSEKNFVTIQNTPTGCWSSVGQLGGQQMINFQSPQCTEKVGTVQHELMHTLGFVHSENDDDGFYAKHAHGHSNDEQNHEHSDEHEHEQSHEHDHDHHDHHHEHNHGDGLANYDIENITKMYECKKATGAQSPFKLTA